MPPLDLGSLAQRGAVGVVLFWAKASGGAGVYGRGISVVGGARGSGSRWGGLGAQALLGGVLAGGDADGEFGMWRW